MKWIKIHHGLYAINRRGEVKRIVGAQGTRAGRCLKPYRSPWMVSLRNGSERTCRTIDSLLIEAFGK